MQQDLTQGSIRRGLIRFSLPLIAGNLLQQLYNIVDTWVVGRFLGGVALAAVGSAFALMVLLTSLLTGLCMGSGVVFSQLYGRGETDRLKTAMVNAFAMVALACAALLLAVYAAFPALLALMRVPHEAVPDIRAYLLVVFAGLPFVFVYNYFACVLRSVGDSLTPLLFLLVSTFLNIALDLLFVVALRRGVGGAAGATVIAQGVSAAGIALRALSRFPSLRPRREHIRLDRPLLGRIASVSLLTGAQQSIMNFGILMIQSLVNSFGVTTMAAFAAGVKIDSFAYSPAQDFANGFATFVAQNTGAGQTARVRRGLREAAALSLTFCLIVSALVLLFARSLLSLFIDPTQTEILAIGARYLRMEGAFYIGIGMLFLLYATYRGLERAGMSVVLTVISLGLRVLIAYAFAPRFGVIAIWLAIPIGWFTADAVGLLGLRRALNRA